MRRRYALRNAAHVLTRSASGPAGAARRLGKAVTRDMSTLTLLLIAILVIMVVAAPLVALMKDYLPAQMEKKANIEQNDNKVYVLHSEIHEHQAQLSALTARRNQHSAENARIDSDARKAEKTIREIENQPPLFVHEVGEPRGNLTKFLVNLTLTKSSGEGKGPVNPIWRCANVAEVWAANQEEAKQAVEVSFPFKLGYNKSFVRAASEDVKPGGKKADESAEAKPPAAGPAAAPPPPSILPNSPGRELRRPSMSAAGGGENTPPEPAPATPAADAPPPPA